MILVLAMLAASSVQSSEYPVNPDTELPSVVKRLGPGDTLVLGPGKYSKGLVLDGLRGTAAAPIGIEGTGAAIVAASERDGILVRDCAYLTLSGLTVRQAQRAGILVSGSQHVTVRNCRITGNGRWGIQTCLSDFVTVTGCEVSGSGREHGIYFSTTDHPTVRDCRVHHNAGCGVHLNGDKGEGGDGMITGALIEKNEIYENGRKGGAAINMDGVEKSTIRGNLIRDNYAGGITCFVEDAARAGSGNRVINNVVRFRDGEGRYALQLLGDVSGIRVQGNTLACGRGPVLEVDKVSMFGLSSDNNRFFAYGRRGVVGIGDERFTLKQWRKMAGQDRRSVMSDRRDPTSPGRASE